MNKKNTIWDKIYRLIIVLSIPLLLSGLMLLYSATSDYRFSSNLDNIIRMGDYQSDIKTAQEIQRARLRYNDDDFVVASLVLCTPFLMFLMFYISHFIIIGDFKYQRTKQTIENIQK